LICKLVLQTDPVATLIGKANGGKIVMSKFQIPSSGTLIIFEDTEGNVVGAMQYDG